MTPETGQLGLVLTGGGARSAYLLRGPVRRDWEHSIPPLDQLRYSVTFRSVRPSAKSAAP